MRRYVRAIHLDGGNNEIAVTAHDVIVQDDTPLFTGLFDADGVRLYAVSDREPVGFKLRRTE